MAEYRFTVVVSDVPGGIEVNVTGRIGDGSDMPSALANALSDVVQRYAERLRVEMEGRNSLPATAIH